MKNMIIMIENLYAVSATLTNFKKNRNFATKQAFAKALRSVN